MRDQWIIWCGLNAEQDTIAAALGSECVSIDGRTPLDEKVRLEEKWRLGEVRCLVTKPDVMGWGLNWQHCHNVIFLGLSDSWESYYQAIRRCWRFGQTQPVHVHVVLSDREAAIWENVMRKEAEAERLSAELVSNAAEFMRSELAATSAGDTYCPVEEVAKPSWLKGMADGPSDTAVAREPMVAMERR